MKLYGSDHSVWLAFEALHDPGNDLRRAGVSLAKEVREPGPVNNPNEWSLKNPANDRDGQVRPGNGGGTLKVLETGNLVV